MSPLISPTPWIGAPKHATIPTVAPVPVTPFTPQYDALSHAGKLVAVRAALEGMARLVRGEWAPGTAPTEDHWVIVDRLLDEQAHLLAHEHPLAP